MKKDISAKDGVRLSVPVETTKPLNQKAEL
jgi:hypothetical protein